MSRGLDAATLLERALAAHAARAGLSPNVTEARSTRWASATFTGARHILTLSLADSDAAGAWLGGLAESDLALRGHLVADLAVMNTVARDGKRVATIEALTVEER